MLPNKLNYSNLNSTAFNSYLQGATVHAENGATDYKLAAVDGIGAGPFGCGAHLLKVFVCVGAGAV